MLFHAWYSKKEHDLRGAGVYLTENNRRVLVTAVCTAKEYHGQPEFDDETYIGTVKEYQIGFLPRKEDVIDESKTELVLNSRVMGFKNESSTIGRFYEIYGSGKLDASPTSDWVIKYCRSMDVEVTFKFQRKQVGYFSPTAYARKGGTVYYNKEGHPVVCTNVCPTKECGDKSEYGQPDDIYLGEVNGVVGSAGKSPMCW